MVGHLEAYLIRLNEETRNTIFSLNKNITDQFKHPIVGIHVRRTDHFGEGKFRDISEYMKKAEIWWDNRQIPASERRIYLATDEPTVYKDAITQYGDYTWLIHQSQGRMSGQGSIGERGNKRETLALLSDWYYLQRVDFLVGTCSSQVTRMAYELSQVQSHNSTQFVSLEDPWYFP